MGRFLYLACPDKALTRPSLLPIPLAFVFSTFCWIAMTAGAVAATKAAANPGIENSDALLLAEILILIVLSRFIGEIMLRLHQPAVMGYLLAGILLGPSVLGLLAPSFSGFLFPSNATQKAMINGISQFGILMLLLLAGMETDLVLIRRVRRAALTTSVAGIALPFAAGFGLGFALPESLLPDPTQRLVVCLFLGTALSISSVKIVATVVRDMGFLRRDIGQVILAAAVVDDTLGWIIIAITLSLAEHGHLDWLTLTKGLLGTLLFLVASFTVGRRIIFRLIQWSNDFGRGEAPVIATILAILAAMALITSMIGVHTVLGAFVAGILVGESPILTRQIDDQLRGITAGLFMPVFFGLSGLGADLTVLNSPQLAILTVLVIGIASVGKASGAFLGSWSAGLSFRQSVALAAGMNARGSTEIVVASIGLSMGVLSDSLYTMIVAMAFVTTVAMPPMLRWALNRIPVDQEEERRLKREEVQAQQIMSSWERILLAADDSSNGKLAARLAGLLAGHREMAVTVLKPTDAGSWSSADNGGSPSLLGDVPSPSPLSPGTSPEMASPADTAAIVKAVSTGTNGDASETPKVVDVIERAPDLSWEAAIAAEGGRGYDLLVIGLHPAADPEGGFTETISRLAKQFSGSLAIVSARGRLDLEPVQAPLHVLVPVTGSEVSRRGAEVGMALAKAAVAKITMLTVLPPEQPGQRRRYYDRESRRYRDAVETAQELNLVAEALEQPIRIRRRLDLSAGDAILREARRYAHNLILLGVSRRPGERLSFGEIAAALLEGADRSLVFVSIGTLPGRTARTEEGAAS